MEFAAEIARTGTFRSNDNQLWFEAAIRSHFQVFLSAYWAARELDLVAPLSETDLDMAYFACYGPTKRAIVGHREKGKTTAVTIPLVSYRLLRDPGRHIILIGSKEEEAIQTGKAIRAQWENERLFFLKCLMPQGRLPDNAKGFSCMGGDPTGRQPSVSCRGIEGATQGGRGNTLLIDDAEGHTNTETYTARQTLKRAFQQANMLMYNNSGYDNGKNADPTEMIGIGTFKNDDSVWASSEFAELRTYPLRYPSQAEMTRYVAPIIVKAVTDDPSLVGRPIDNIRFTESRIIEKFGAMAIAGSTHPEYLRELQCVLRANSEDRYPLKIKDWMVDTIDRETAPLTTTWGESDHNGDTVVPDVPCLGFEGDKLLRPIWRSPERAPYEGRIMAIDPGGVGNDEFAYCIMLWLGGYLFVPVVKGLRKMAYADMVDQAVNDARDWKVSRVFFESNQDGTGLFEELLRSRILLQRQPQCSLHPQGWCPSPEGIRVQSWSTKKKNQRIVTALRGPMSTHRLIISKEAAYDASIRDAGEYQLQVQVAGMSNEDGFEMPNDDRADVLAFAVACADMHGVIGLDPKTRKAIREDGEEVGDGMGGKRRRRKRSNYLREANGTAGFLSS